MLNSYENTVPQGDFLQFSTTPQRAGNDPPGVSNPSDTETEISTMREKFLTSVTKLVESKSYNSKVFSKEKYFQTIKEVKEAKEKGKKSSRDYRRAARYDVISVAGTEKLIEAAHRERDRIRYYVHKEELFDILHDTHLNIGHGGRTRMLKELQGKYGNVTKEVIVLYLTLCKQCHQKNPVPKRGLAPKPMPCKDNDSRCQVEILDMQSNADGEFKFILYYQDHVTKFIILRPLKAKQAHEVVSVLLDIFTILGPPSVLESDSGIEFTNQVVNELNEVWPDLKIVLGKSHPGQGHPGLDWTLPLYPGSLPQGDPSSTTLTSGGCRSPPDTAGSAHSPRTRRKAPRHARAPRRTGHGCGGKRAPWTVTSPENCGSGEHALEAGQRAWGAASRAPDFWREELGPGGEASETELRSRAFPRHQACPAERWGPH
uniref:Integrase catalytic domain-containing protein n=1 Tax=Capra hircus TaxID=9925 RepID=A0A8C2S5P9_CAPHI